MRSPTLIGVSLKMYFGFNRTLAWCVEVAALAQRHPAIAAGNVELFVLPTAPAIAPALTIFAGGPVAVGAQDVFWEPSGAFTGETGAPFLAEMGCRYAELGHAERRRIFNESIPIIGAKTAAVAASGLVPVICLGEVDHLPADAAARHCLNELTQILSTTSRPTDIVVAYEPVWAIGAAEPAGVEHISAVCQALHAGLSAAGAGPGSRVIYGGSAQPGLITKLNGTVDGLFLGRFAHDPAALAQILDEVPL